jgi:hypothetical protein
MTSKEQYAVESLVREAEREFNKARRDVRSTARTYERCRDARPLSRWSIQARGKWNLNVIDWITKAVALEEALERALLLDRDAGRMPASSTKREGDLSSASSLEDDFDGDMPQPLGVAIDELDQPLRKRISRSEDGFKAAGEKLREARALADRAYAAYRQSRAVAPGEQVRRLREEWRSALVRWSEALRAREIAREETLAALRRTRPPQSTRPHRDEAGQEPGFTGNTKEYDPDEDLLF